MYIQADGLPIPLQDNNGNPIRVEIMENSASFKDQQNGLKASASAVENDKRDLEERPRQLAELMKRDDAANSCHCLWVTPPPPS
jgi:hypothetical protein